MTHEDAQAIVQAINHLATALALAVVPLGLFMVAAAFFSRPHR